MVVGSKGDPAILVGRDVRFYDLESQLVHRLKRSQERLPVTVARAVRE